MDATNTPAQDAPDTQPAPAEQVAPPTEESTSTTATEPMPTEEPAEVVPDDEDPTAEVVCYHDGTLTTCGHTTDVRCSDCGKPPPEPAAPEPSPLAIDPATLAQAFRLLGLRPPEAE